MHQLSSDDPSSELSSSTKPLAEIVARACKKDHQAFEMLYEHYKKPLGKRLMALVNNKETAYDLYQETFVRIWKSISIRRRVPFGLDFEPWLYHIARNLAFDYLRRNRKFEFLRLFRDETDELQLHELSRNLGVAENEEQVVELLCLNAALAKMTPKYRNCLLLQVQWGYTQKEIAQILRIKEKSVSANVCRGYEQLRKIYKKMMEDHPEAKKEGSERNG